MATKHVSRSRNRRDSNRMNDAQDDVHEKLMLQALKAVKKGDFSVRLPVDWTGVVGKIADELNSIIEMNAMLAEELKRVSHVVGKKGKLSDRAALPEASGEWKSNIEAVNGLIDDLVRPTTEMARVIGAVAKGDLTQSVALEAEGIPLRGEFLTTAKTVNSMVGRLDAFAAEVTRVAREVGTEGKLGGQAVVPGVAGTWKDLTDSVNSMASNLTNQVRNIADVTTAVANGDLSKKITADVRGEILQLKDTINTMVDQLRSFAAEVTRVAREVGTEGKLGGQAVVPGVAGTWKDLTDSVNSMASNLTNQVRNIADVTVAVANGDLSKKITVDVRGEILQLKDTINTMVDQLRSFAAEVTRVAREVGHGGQAGWPGAGPGCQRRVEGSHREREPHGRQSHGPGAQYRRRDDGGGERRPLEEDHGRRAGRNSPAQGSHQYDGGPVAQLCGGSDARGPRGGHGGQTGRAGGRAGSRRHVERFDRQRQFHGQQSHQSSA